MKLDGLIGALGFWAGAADILTRHARRVALDDDEERLLHLIAHAGLRVGEPLLRAENEEDHAARIRTAILEPDLLYLSLVGYRYTFERNVDETFARARAPALAEVFGRGAIPVLGAGDTGAAAIADAVAQRRLHIGGLDVSVDHGDLLHFLQDPAFPEPVYTTVVLSLEAAACFTAMALAVISRREVRPRIAATLADRWVRAQPPFLWVLASLPGVSLLPLFVSARPFDPDRLFAGVTA
jgi:hypothetical protein